MGWRLPGRTPGAGKLHRSTLFRGERKLIALEPAAFFFKGDFEILFDGIEQLSGGRVDRAAAVQNL